MDSEDRSMKFILIGKHTPEWSARFSTRSAMAYAKTKELGITVECSYYTQGRFSYVTVIDAPDASTASRFGIWYAAQGFGTVEILQGFDSAEMRAITEDIWASNVQRSPAKPAAESAVLESALDLPVFESYTQEELDYQYNPRLSVPGFPQIAADWAARSAAVRRQVRCSLDLPYGPHPQETLDVFHAGQANAPIHVFFHGGYWRSGDKSDYSFIAPALLQAGVNVVVPNYALCPTVSIGELLEQCYRALRWIHANAASFGGDPSRLHVSGHSAGGHIVAMSMTEGMHHGLAEGTIKSGLALSGLYNLEPLRRSFLNLEIRLDPEQVKRASPQGLLRRTAAPLMLSVGGDESHEFHRQTTDYLGAWTDIGNVATYLPVAKTNHYSVLDALADPSHPLCKALLAQMER